MSLDHNNILELPKSQTSWQEDIILSDTPSFWECNPPETFAELDTAINAIPIHEFDDEKRRLHAIYTEILARNLFKNAEIASYSHENPTDKLAIAKFTKFPKLPPELRIRVWKYALLIPQIVELQLIGPKSCKVPSCIPGMNHAHLYQDPTLPTNNNHGHIFYRNANPPALLSTCFQSRNEALQHYSQYQSGRIVDISQCCQGPIWFRPDHDILFLKDFAFDYYNRCFNNDGTWGNIPEIFTNVRALALNREILNREDSGQHILYQKILARHFPNLLCFVILIDDDVDIDESWGIKLPNGYNDGGDDNDERNIYEEYERFKEHPNLPRPAELYPRATFVKACTGPFTKSVFNNHYASYLKRISTSTSKAMLRWGFLDEYGTASQLDIYSPPRVEIMGCHLPSGIELPLSAGRIPFYGEGLDVFGVDAGGLLLGNGGKEREVFDDIEMGYDGSGYDVYGRNLC